MENKWAVLVTPENKETLQNWYVKNIHYYKDCRKEWHLGMDGYFHYPPYTSNCHTTVETTIKKLNYEIISFEQWKQQYCIEHYEIY